MALLSKFQVHFVGELLKHKVQFLIVGGVAVVYHGVQRGTGDLDILLKPGTENGRNLLAAFKDLNLDATEISPADFETDLFLSVGFQPDAIDLMTSTPGINFDAAASRANFLTEQGLTVPFGNIDDLIANKESLNRTGEKRHLDQFDVLELKRIRQIKL